MITAQQLNDTEQTNTDIAMPVQASNSAIPEAMVPQASTSEATITSSIDEPKANMNNWPKIQEALSQGYSRQEVSSFLSSSQGLDPNEADKQIVESVQQKIKQATNQGYNLEEVRDYLITSRYDGSVIDSAIKMSQVPKAYKIYQWDPNTKAEEAQDLSDLYKNVYGKYSTFGKQLGGIFNEEMGREARREVNQLNVSIADKLNKDFGLDTFIDPNTGELMLRDESGVVNEVDSSMLNDIFNSKLEIAGAMTGAATGAAAGGNIGAAAGAVIGGVAGNLTGIGLVLPEEAVTVPAGAAIGRAIGTAAGAIAGSMGGSALGKAADMTLNAFQLKEQLEGSLYLSQMKEAAVFDAAAGAIGLTIFKMGKAGYKTLAKAYDFVVAGNKEGAYKALVDNLLLTDDQAKEIVGNWETVTGKEAPGKSFEEKAVGVLATTQQGAESFVGYATSKDPKAAMQVITDIDKRAKDIVKLADNVADENVGQLVREQLGEHVKDVKNYYGQVKQIAADAIDGTDFRFDYDKLAIDPVLKSIEKGISNPIRQEQFLLYSQRIANASEDRTFSGLVNLRQAVNDFKYSRTKLKTPDLDAINKVLNKIDTQIAKGAKEYMPEQGNAWLKQFSNAKTQYSKMKQMEGNVLYKALNRKGITEEGVQKFFGKYINALDDTFIEVMEKLPSNTKTKVEGAVVKNYIDRYTLGYATDKQALHFPEISRALQNLNISTPQAKYLKESIDGMAKVFKNDVNLSKISGNIAVPKFQSYLTIDPVMRAKYEIASGVFNWAKTKALGKEANNLALLRKLEKVLENPMSFDATDKFLKSMPAQQQEGMKLLVDELRVALKTKPNPQKQVVKMYKQTASGKISPTNGVLGKGVYLVDKVKKPNPTSKVVAQEVDMRTLATVDDISNLVGRTITENDLKEISGLQSQLVERGFKGIRLESKAMLFTDDVTRQIVKQPEAGKTFYRGVDGDFLDKEFTFWTDRKDQAQAYAEGAALTNTGKNPKVLEKVMKDGKGKNIETEILEALEEGLDFDEVAKEIMVREDLDWVEYMHPSTKGEDHLVRVVRNKQK